MRQRTLSALAALDFGSKTLEALAENFGKHADPHEQDIRFLDAIDQHPVLRELNVRIVLPCRRKASLAFDGHAAFQHFQKAPMFDPDIVQLGLL